MPTPFGNVSLRLDFFPQQRESAAVGKVIGITGQMRRFAPTWAGLWLFAAVALILAAAASISGKEVIGPEVFSLLELAMFACALAVPGVWLVLGGEA